MKKENCPNEEEVSRKAKIIKNKIQAVVEKQKGTATTEDIWIGALSVLEEALLTDGEYAADAILLMSMYSPESLGDLCNRVREGLKKYASLTEEKVWESKIFYSLILKSMFTPEAYADEEVIDRIIDLCMDSSPKVRKRAMPTLRRVIENEKSKNKESHTFLKLVQMVQALSSSSPEYTGRAVSILGNLTQEIVQHNLIEKMITIASNMQGAAEKMCIPAVTFAMTVLKSSLGQYLQEHLQVFESAARKGCSSVEETVILLEYATEILKQNSVCTTLEKMTPLLQSEGTETESLIRDIIQAEIERAGEEKLPLEVCTAVHSLLYAAGESMFPSLKKIILLLANHCFEKRDIRITKEIELIIGIIGVERFLKTVKNKEFYFWLPMMRAAVHSTDLNVFFTRFIPEIQKLRNTDRATEYENLWACFPSFCRKAKDEKNVLQMLLDLCINYTNSPLIRGYICQGVHTLVDESMKRLSSGELSPEEVGEYTKRLQTIASSIELFKKIMFRFCKDPTENERMCIRSMLLVIDAKWQIDYFNGIIEKCFIHGEAFIPSGELRPELNRKENDVPECERVFIEHAPVFEIVASGLVDNKKVQEGVLKYCLSTHLRTQKMAYKVLLAMIKSGYAPKTLLEFFMHPTADKVLFLCSRYLYLLVLYELIKVHGIVGGETMCKVVFEAIRTIKIEGGRNRKTAFDITEEMAVKYNSEQIEEICKMACAGIPKGLVDYQAGAICFLTTIIYTAGEKVSLDMLDSIFEIIETLSAEKKYATSKALIGYISVLLTTTPHIERYLDRSLICIDRVIFHFKMKMHENLKLLLRKITEKRPDAHKKFTYPQKELLKHRPQNRTEEKERIVFTDDKIHIRDQEIVPKTRVKRVRRS